MEEAGRLASVATEEMLVLDEALTELSREDALGGRLVELRYFAGLTVEQAAEILGVSPATAYRHWSFARAWLHAQIDASKKNEKK
jgi:RNA polymerase sigma factor (sigma-70 family)